MSTVDSQESAPVVIQWQEDFSIHIDEIDREHQHFFKLINALNLETVDATMGELLDYTVRHFSNEEEWMHRSGYPGLDAHMQQHRELERVVVDLSENGPPWSDERLQDLRVFVHQWLVNHILFDDLKFGTWYAKHPLAGGLGAPATSEDSMFMSQLLKRE